MTTVRTKQEGASRTHCGLDFVHDEAHDTLSNLAEEAIEPIQSTDVILYAMADRFDIAALKDLAKSKFRTRGWSSWSRALPNIIELVYTSTPETGRGLHDVLQGPTPYCCIIASRSGRRGDNAY